MNVPYVTFQIAWPCPETNLSATLQLASVAKLVYANSQLNVQTVAIMLTTVTMYYEMP